MIGRGVGPGGSRRLRKRPARALYKTSPPRTNATRTRVRERESMVRCLLHSQPIQPSYKGFIGAASFSPLPGFQCVVICGRTELRVSSCIRHNWSAVSDWNSRISSWMRCWDVTGMVQVARSLIRFHLIPTSTRERVALKVSPENLFIGFVHSPGAVFPLFSSTV